MGLLTAGASLAAACRLWGPWGSPPAGGRPWLQGGCLTAEPPGKQSTGRFCSDLLTWLLQGKKRWPWEPRFMVLLMKNRSWQCCWGYSLCTCLESSPLGPFVSGLLIEWFWCYILFAAAAAKSLQLCPTLCDPIDSSPPGSPVPGILQARTLEWVAISFSSVWKWKVKVKSLSRVRPLATPWTAAHQAPPSLGFSRQGYWSGVPLPSPHILFKKQ